MRQKGKSREVMIEVIESKLISLERTVCKYLDLTESQVVSSDNVAFNVVCLFRAISVFCFLHRLKSHLSNCFTLISILRNFSNVT